MYIRRLIPYLVGLLVLAFALGSLPRGTPGGSLLFQSYWLLYLIYLAPIAILGLMVALIILIGLNWKSLGAGLGFAIANRRKMRSGRKKSRYSLLLYIGFWSVAILVLATKKGTIFNPAAADQNVTRAIVNDATPPPNPLQGGGLLPAISSIVQNDWFSFAFAGLLIVSGLVLFQTLRTAIHEPASSMYYDVEEAQLEGLQAVHEAMKLVDDKANDPRSRIILCYQHMLATVSRVGVLISSDQTARELEKASRSTFSLKGPATSDLTRLFEEARYSLHEIVDEDATRAGNDLEAISAELKIQLND